jgi:beta-N-acetylhexosaminidase
MKFHYLFILFLVLFACRGKHTKSTTPTTPVSESKEKQEKAKKKDFPPNSEDSLDIKIGQMILVGINDRTQLAENDSLRLEIAGRKVGGVILFEKNISKTNSFETLKKLIEDLQSESQIPLFVSIDEEGGKVHRLKEKYGFVKMPSASYLGSMEDVDSTYYYAKRLANELSDLGININFAPAVDLALNPTNPIIAKVNRSYSDDYNEVVTHAQAFIKAHHHYDVKTTIKHYPGHGSSASDTHKGIADVTKQWQFKELIPFKKIIELGNCDAVISCHIINCHLDTTCVPATLSKIINTEILRELLEFNGVLFSDDMQMNAIAQNYGRENAIKMAINSGVDVLVFGNNVNLTDRITASEMHAMIKKLVKAGEVSETRINEAYARIMALKKKRY